MGVLRIISLILLVLTALACPAAGQLADGPLLSLADVKGRTGGFRITITEHDPRTANLADVAKRMGLKQADANGAAYDLAQRAFFVYVPKTPGDGGKFGVMAGLCFKDSPHPADAWPDVLERHHLIWVGAVDSDDSKPPVRRTALLLDAVHNVRKAWAVDADRIYLSMNTSTGAAAGTAIYFSDVFTGMIESPQALWFAKVKGFERPPLTWDATTIPRPQAADLAKAKSRSRFFLVGRDHNDVPTDPAGKTDPLAGNAELRRIVRHGYQSIGFKFVQGLVVPKSAMDDYVQYAADWFDQGVTFIDAPLEAQRRRTAAVAAPTQGSSSPNRSGSPVGPIRVPGGVQVPTPGGIGVGGLGY